MRTQVRNFINNVEQWWKSSFSYGDYKGVPFPRDITSTKWNFHTSYYIPIVGSFGKVFLSLGNSVKVYNRETFLKHVHNRGPSVPLITICNHSSMIDDPFLIGNICDLKLLFSTNLMRWSLGAKELMCFNRFTSFITAHGKVIPTVRGDGIYQPAVSFAIEQLNRGQWIQIFPEGKITLDPIRFKWGIGRMITECLHNPVVIPFWHSGMEDVFPTREPYYPRLGKKVTVLFGEPIMYHDLLKQSQLENLSETAKRKVLTDYIQEALYKLKPEAEKLHYDRFKG